VSQQDADLVLSCLQKDKASKTDNLPQIERIDIAFEERDIIKQQRSIASYLSEKKDPSERSAVCIDLTCLKAAYAPGVSEPNAMFGLSDQQLI